MAKKDINNNVNLKSQIATSSLEYATVFNNDGQGGRNIGPEACAPPHTGRGRGRSGAKRNGVLPGGASPLEICPGFRQWSGRCTAGSGRRLWLCVRNSPKRHQTLPECIRFHRRSPLGRDGASRIGPLRGPSSNQSNSTYLSRSPKSLIDSVLQEFSPAKSRTEYQELPMYQRVKWSATNAYLAGIQRIEGSRRHQVSWRLA